MSAFNNWKIIVILCLTLGLAPFIPEPHLFGKVRWVLGGAHGMQLMDWFDVALHGFPFIILIRLIIIKLLKKNGA
jgi:hypothetical protein